MNANKDIKKHPRSKYIDNVKEGSKRKLDED